MKITTRLLSLTALNILVSVGMGFVGYLGIERLHPDRTNLVRYNEAIKQLHIADGNREALHRDVLKGTSLAKSPDKTIGSFAEVQLSAREHAQDLKDALTVIEGLSLPDGARQTISLYTEPLAIYTQTALTMLDWLQSQSPHAAATLERLTKESYSLANTQRNVSAGLHSFVSAEQQVNVAFAHGLQRVMLVTLLSGLVCILLILRITLRSIISPIQQAVESLGEAATEVNASSRAMSERAQELSQRASEQAAAVQQSVDSMAEVSSMIAESSASSEESLSTMDRIAQRTNSGTEVMQHLAVSADAISKANTHLRDMVTIIEEISAKTSIINDIAFKTQLLSFNASIEAARAGQHGKGFAVVAEEFGNLAQVSGEAAKEIQSLLEKSKKQVTILVETTNQRSSDGQRISNEAVAIFSEIAQEINHMTKQVQRVVTATHEQQVGVKQATTVMHQMDQTAQRHAQLAKDTLQSATELSEYSTSLSRIMNDLLTLTSSAEDQKGNPSALTSIKPDSSAQRTEVLELDSLEPDADSMLLEKVAQKVSENGRRRSKIADAPASSPTPRQQDR